MRIWHGSEDFRNPACHCITCSRDFHQIPASSPSVAAPSAWHGKDASKLLREQTSRRLTEKERVGLTVRQPHRDGVVPVRLLPGPIKDCQHDRVIGHPLLPLLISPPRTDPVSPSPCRSR